MMNFRFFLAPLVMVLLFADAGSTYAQAEKESGVKEAMREKVAHSQQVLLGLTLEDYGLIAKNAEKLVELSNKTNWYSRQVPEYELFLNEFRRNAQDLMTAGKQKNLDAASLAYVQMTLSCISCHALKAPAPGASWTSGQWSMSETTNDKRRVATGLSVIIRGLDIRLSRGASSVMRKTCQKLGQMRITSLVRG